MGAWNPSEGLSVGALVFAGPTVNVCGLHRIPFSGALRVFEHRTADAVFPLLGGHEHYAVPRHILLTGVSHLLIGLDNRVRRLHVTERLEWRDEAHVIGHGLLTLVTGDDPFEEVLGGLLVDHIGQAGGKVLCGSGRQLMFMNEVMGEPVRAWWWPFPKNLPRFSVLNLPKNL